MCWYGVKVLRSEPCRGVKGHTVQEHVSGRGILDLDFEKNVVLHRSHDSHMTRKMRDNNTSMFMNFVLTSMVLQPAASHNDTKQHKEIRAKHTLNLKNFLSSNSSPDVGTVYVAVHIKLYATHSLTHTSTLTH